MIEVFSDILLFLICLGFSAFFSGSEVALIAITRAKVRTLLNEKRVGAQSLAELKESPDRILITILVGNNIFNISATAIATAAAIKLWGGIGVGIATGAVIILLLLFGEIGPKLYASRTTEKFALTVAPVILFLSRLLNPVFWLIEHYRARRTAEGAPSEPVVTEDEIKEWIDVGKEGGTIEQEERELLYSVFEFGDTSAREIMTPRVDVVLMEDTHTLDSALKIFNETGFSRIPVYHDQVDNITGVLNVKDVLSSLIEGKRDESIRNVMYDPFFVPESKKIDDLLKELRMHRVHLAIVLDEYSTFVGIVTVENILEELVGDILDEFDQEEPDIQKVSPNAYIIDAQVWVRDVNEDLSLSLPEDEAYETIGGLVIDHLGHIPHPGESIGIPEVGATLVVTQMHGRRVVKVKLLLSGNQGPMAKEVSEE